MNQSHLVKPENFVLNEFAQDTIAIVYDFDGTLSPKPMQEYTVLPALGIDANEFWEQVNDKADREQAEVMLMYMHLLVEKIHEKKIGIRRNDFSKMGEDIQYFPGVETWFSRINNYVLQQKNGRFKVRHYIISAGLKEILLGCSIRDEFHQIYASEYLFNEYDAPVFPKLVITDTSKTQFLFRINKGRELPRDSINEHMPQFQRPIPFSNMIYIGDGMTDVPSMAVVKQQGGHALSVYDAFNPKGTSSNKGLEVCQQLIKASRVDFYAEADYKEGSRLEALTQLLLDFVMEKMHFQSIVHNQFIG